MDEPAGQSDIQYYQQLPPGEHRPQNVAFQLHDGSDPVHLPPTGRSTLIRRSGHRRPRFSGSFIGRRSTQNFASVFCPNGYTLGAAGSVAMMGTVRNNTHARPGGCDHAPGLQPIRTASQRIADSGPLHRAGKCLQRLGGRPVRVRDGPPRGNRPIILHRPFNNVGELGYVSRDYPWRNPGLSSRRRAPTPDCWTFSRPANNTTPTNVGRINLNTRNLPALYAMLSGGVNNVLAGTSMTATNALSISKEIISFTAATTSTAGPAHRQRDELATRYVPTMRRPRIFRALRPRMIRNIKARRETAVRSLAEVGPDADVET